MVATLDFVEGVEIDSGLAQDIYVLLRKHAARPPTFDLDEATLKVAYWIKRSRAARDMHIPSSLFGEPAWNMLIELFISSRRGETSVAKSICFASGAPYSTAWRWLRQLECEGLVQTGGDLTDHRRKLVSLTEQGNRSVTACLEDFVRMSQVLLAA